MGYSYEKQLKRTLWSGSFCYRRSQRECPRSKAKSNKSFLLLIFSCCVINVTTISQGTAKVSIVSGNSVVINKNIYGHFAEHLGRSIYDGFYRNGKIRIDIVDALNKIHVPVLRWPGGCFADRYHWKDGIGKKRPARLNTNWGMVKEDNSFGTDEYIQLCKLLHCEPYIAGNMGTGSAQEMKEWIEYVNYEKKYNISFIGVGNESWDCGGDMTPEYYSDQYRQFASFLPDYPGTHLRKVACGAYGNNTAWTETVMKNVGPTRMWGLSLHYYVFANGFGHKGSATAFSEQEYFAAMKKTLQLESILRQHSAIMDRYDPEKKVALVVDEWGIWTDVEAGTNPDFLYQQNSLRDALIAASTLNIFNNHADRVRMANLAQTVNVLQALVLTKGDSMVLTPTYHVFDLYKVHQDAKLLALKITAPYYTYGNDSIASVNAGASKDSNGIIHISMVNIDPRNSIEVNTSLAGIGGRSVTGQVLSSSRYTDVNSFREPKKISIKVFEGFKKQSDELRIVLPAKSVVVLEIK